MASYLMDIDEQNEKAKCFLEFLKDYTKDNKFVDIEKALNRITRKAIQDAQKGKTSKADSVKALFDNI